MRNMIYQSLKEWLLFLFVKIETEQDGTETVIWRREQGHEENEQKN